jgi:hypothetical protein
MTSNPKWDKNKPIVPFDKTTGDMRMDAYYWQKNVEWRPVGPWKSAMKIVDWNNTNGSAILTLMDNQGKKYPIYIADFFDVVSHCRIKDGYIEECIWTFKKTGRNYAIKLFQV